MYSDLPVKSVINRFVKVGFVFKKIHFMRTKWIGTNIGRLYFNLVSEISRLHMPVRELSGTFQFPDFIFAWKASA
jgi:hypothetical protein